MTDKHERMVLIIFSLLIILKSSSNQVIQWTGNQAIKEYDPDIKEITEYTDARVSSSPGLIMPWDPLETSDQEEDMDMPCLCSEHELKDYIQRLLCHKCQDNNFINEIKHRLCKAWKRTVRALQAINFITDGEVIRLRKISFMPNLPGELCGIPLVFDIKPAHGLKKSRTKLFNVSYPAISDSYSKLISDFFELEYGFYELNSKIENYYESKKQAFEENKTFNTFVKLVRDYEENKALLMSKSMN